MFWETTVSDYLLVEMFKMAVVNSLDPEFTKVMYDEIQKRKLTIDPELKVKHSVPKV